MHSHNPGFLKLVDAARARVREVSVSEVRARKDRGEDFFLVDVREEGEWNAGRAVGAEHLGKGIIERDVESRFPALDTPLVLYCGGGYRSVLAADVLQTMGYTRVESMAGGWKAWVSEGGPCASPGP
ncbi:MAG: rhodanese-like domain-containing protein [Candidatus Sericytochromatia bacterium]|nr:rhodanese-like domain-containing protein [Candidatus Sericytochromatia bacterium]